MSIAPRSARPEGSPPIGLESLDEAGRRARTERVHRALDEIEGITDPTDTDAVWDEVLRGIDEARPHRPLFAEGP